MKTLGAVAKGAGLGVLVAIAVGAAFGLVTCFRLPQAEIGPSESAPNASAKARRLALSISEGMNCGAGVALLAIPLGAVLAAVRSSRRRG